MKKQLIVVAGLLASLAVVLVLATQLGGPAPVERIAEGQKAPEFRATTLATTPEPRTFRDSYGGKVVLVNVWATWCAPCRVEMPSIERLYRELSAEGLHVVAVAVDDVGAEQRIRDFVAGIGLSFDILHDPSGNIERDWQADGIPSTYLIDRSGVIRRYVRGSTEWDTPEVIAFVRSVLAESSGD